MNTSVVAMFSGRFRVRSAEFRVAEELGQHQVEEVHGHCGQVGEHDDRRGDQSPAAHPADPGSEGARCPREGGSGVGHGVVQFPVAEGNQQHRNEAHQEDGRQLDADFGDSGAEGRGEGVGGGNTGHTDDDGADQAHRSGFEALGAQSCVGVVRGLGRHVFGAHWCASPDVSFDVEWFWCLSS